MDHCAGVDPDGVVLAPKMARPRWRWFAAAPNADDPIATRPLLASSRPGFMFGNWLRFRRAFLRWVGYANNGCEQAHQEPHVRAQHTMRALVLAGAGQGRGRWWQSCGTAGSDLARRGGKRDCGTSAEWRGTSKRRRARARQDV